MKNIGNLLLVGAIMVFVLGCNCGFGGFGQQEPTPPKRDQPTTSQPKQPTTTGNNENKSLADRATDVVTTGEKIGIQECDELMDMLRTKIENDNTDFITKGVLKALEGQFRQKIKESIEQNQADRDATGAMCKELKKSFEEQQQQTPQK